MLDEMCAIGVFMADLGTSWTNSGKMRSQFKMLQKIAQCKRVSRLVQIQPWFENRKLCATMPAGQGQTILLVDCIFGLWCSIIPGI